MNIFTIAGVLLLLLPFLCLFIIIAEDLSLLDAFIVFGIVFGIVFVVSAGVFLTVHGLSL